MLPAISIIWLEIATCVGLGAVSTLESKPKPKPNQDLCELDWFRLREIGPREPLNRGQTDRGKAGEPWAMAQMAHGKSEPGCT